LRSLTADQLLKAVSETLNVARQGEVCVSLRR
jgi:hypothetical protein